MLTSQVKFSAYRQMDRQMDTGKTICLNLSMRGPKKQSRYMSLTLYQTTNFRLFQTKRVCRRQFQI